MGEIIQLEYITFHGTANKCKLEGKVDVVFEILIRMTNM